MNLFFFLNIQFYFYFNSGLVDNNSNNKSKNSNAIITLHPPELGFPGERGKRVSIMAQGGNLHISSLLSTANTPSSPPRMANTSPIHSPREEMKLNLLNTMPSTGFESIISPHKNRLGI
jgi:hypothetical protein